MHYYGWLSLAFAACAFAKPNTAVDRISARNVQSLPAIKKTIEVLSQDGKELDEALQALTKENAATQIDIIVDKLNKLGADTSARTAKLNVSGSIGIMEIAGFLSQDTQDNWKALLKTTSHIANQTTIDIVAKRDIIKESGKIGSVTAAIRAQKKGIVDIIAIVPGQVPPFVKTAIANAAKQRASKAAEAAATATPGSPPPAKAPAMPDLNSAKAQEDIGKAVDKALDQIVAILEGKQDKFILPPRPARKPKPTPTPTLVPTAEASEEPAPPKASPERKRF